MSAPLEIRNSATGKIFPAVGPFLIGATADRVGLRTALAIPLAAAVAVLAVTAGMRPLGRRPGIAAGVAR